MLRDIRHHVVQAHIRIHLILIENVVPSTDLEPVTIPFLDRELNNVLANVFVHRRELAIVVGDFVVCVKLNDLVVYFERLLLPAVLVSTNEKVFLELGPFATRLLQMGRQRDKPLDNFVLEILLDDDENVDLVD